MIETQIVGEQVAGEAAKVRKELYELVNKLNKSTFDIAELLHKVKSNKFYYPDFETFTEFCKSLDLKQSKANYLERIVDVMEDVGIDRNTYEPLGIRKLIEISSLDPTGYWVNPENNEQKPLRDIIPELVSKGKDLSYNQVREHVQTLKGLVGENQIINETFGWPLETKQEIIDPAIELARRNLGSAGKDKEGNAVEISKSRCVQLWAAEYLDDPANNTYEEEE